MAQAETNLTGRPPVVEVVTIPDLFCTDLVKVERIGPCYRLLFCVNQAANYESPEGLARRELAIVARIVIPAEALGTMLYNFGTLSAAPSAPSFEALPAATDAVN